MMSMTAITTTMLRACALDLAKMATILVHVLTLSMSSCHSRELLVLFGSFLVSLLKMLEPDKRKRKWAHWKICHHSTSKQHTYTLMNTMSVMCMHVFLKVIGS